MELNPPLLILIRDDQNVPPLTHFNIKFSKKGQRKGKKTLLNVRSFLKAKKKGNIIFSLLVFNQPQIQK